MLRYLTREQALNNSSKFFEKSGGYYACLWSNVHGSITTDRKLMQIPILDDFVQKGHAVFDACALEEGKTVNLNWHLERFQNSAKKAKLSFPEEANTPEKLKELVKNIISFSKLKDQMIRMWLTNGFEGKSPNLYIAVDGKDPLTQFKNQVEGISEYMMECQKSNIPSFNSTSGLYENIVSIEAQEKGSNSGIILDGEGNVLQTSDQNIFCLFQQKDQKYNFLTRQLDSQIKQTIDIQRVLEIVQTMSDVINEVQLRPFKVEELMKADEVTLVGESEWKTVNQVDGKKIKGGNTISQLIRSLVYNNKEAAKINYDQYS